MKHFSFYALAFASGAAIMILEICAARALAPHFGNGTTVWTAIIGVVLGAMTLGYLIGGHWTSKFDRTQLNWTIVNLLLVSGVWVSAVGAFKYPVAVWIAEHLANSTGALVASICFFSIPALLLASMSPIIVELAPSSHANPGKEVGILSGFAAIGSISGTFFAGFWAIEAFGHGDLIKLVAGGLIGIGFLYLLVCRVKKLNQVSIAVALVACAFLILTQNLFPQNGIKEIESKYARYWLYDYLDRDLNRPVRVLRSGSGGNLAKMFLDRPQELAMLPLKSFNLDQNLCPNPTNSLLVGGGAFLYVGDYLSRFPDSQLTTIEIDPALIGVAQKYFGFRDNPRHQVVVAGARTFINNTSEKYDLIYLDVFNSTEIPFQVVTQEAAQKYSQSLSGCGILFANVIDGRSHHELLDSIQKSFRPFFHTIEAYRIPGGPSRGSSNYLVVAKKYPVKQGFSSVNPFLGGMMKEKVVMSGRGVVLRDDHAPVQALRRRSF
jgi:hypothetical protein